MVMQNGFLTASFLSESKMESAEEFADCALVEMETSVSNERLDKDLSEEYHESE